MSKKNLFICGTPLQSIIVKKIIESEGLEKKNCILFFYTYVKNDKHDRYYALLSELFSESYYYLCDNKYPSYVIDAKKIFSGLDFSNIYFAAVHSSFVLLALSLGKHKRIYTFDDGTANVFPRSSYAAKYGLSFKKFFGLVLFGNRYNIQRIRNESLAHYTIYPGFENNISDNLISLEIFPALSGEEKAGKCSLILGTVFREIFLGSKIEETLSNLSRFSQNVVGDVYYLPHPRSMETTIQGCRIIDSGKIAEEIIGELYQEYGSIDVYGFSSSAQFNVAHLAGLNNYLLSSSALKYSVKEISEMAADAGISLGTIIDLDQYSS